MVKTSIVGVKALNPYRHVPSLTLAVVRTLSVHHPVAAGRCDSHLTSRRYKVCREAAFKRTYGIFGIKQHEFQVVVVKLRAGIHLYLLGIYLYIVVAVTAWRQNYVHTL